uniref:Translocon-associated protein subunit beta n=1 Tax=Phallusia mammillata TaxID=59560 RepID=A0A6F9DT55_9ASCI|nr:translocon-associated protein subunit beta-like [Phallusia mammillata]
MSLKLITIFLIACAGLVHAEDGDAKLILIKNVLNSIITEGNDLMVQYTLYNIGDGAATDVNLADSSFHESDFELVSGMTSVKWERILAGTNVSHVVIVRPLKSGAFNFTSAVVQYVASEGSDTTFGMSNDLGELDILSLKEFKRIHASHLIEWGLFGVWCIPSIVLPYMLYYKSKSKYSLKAKKN